MDQVVQGLVAQCCCQPLFQMRRIEEGKYAIGEGKGEKMMVRIVGQQIMVRVGGGWEEVHHYFEKHDRCRSDKRLQWALKRYVCPGRWPLPREPWCRCCQGLNIPLFSNSAKEIFHANHDKDGTIGTIELPADLDTEPAVRDTEPPVASP
jgi:hypothetical protein